MTIWHLMKFEDGIHTYIADGDDPTLYNCKSQCRISNSLEHVIKPFVHIAKINEWIRPCKLLKIDKLHGDRGADIYTVINIPLMRDRDAFIHFGYYRGSDAASISFRAVDGPSGAGCVRLKHMRGMWQLQAIAEHDTRATFIIQLRFGEDMPKTYGNKLLSATVHTMMSSLQARVGLKPTEQYKISPPLFGKSVRIEGQ